MSIQNTTTEKMHTKQKIRQMKAAPKELVPVVRIGKNGLTEGICREIKRQLYKNKVIKVKMLDAFLEGKDKKQAAKEIAAKIGAELVQQTGFVVVLARKSI